MIDEIKVEELYLYTVNNGNLYRTKAKSIMENLAKKKISGKYDHDLAVKAWMYLVEDGLRSYNKEFSEESLKLTKEEKTEVAKEIQSHYDEELEDTVEKLQKGKSKKSDYEGSDEPNLDDVEDEKIRALLKYLKEEEDIIVDPADVSLYDKNQYDIDSTELNREYLVCTPDEALEEAKNEVKGSFEEMGLEAFTPNFQETILTECIDHEELDRLKEQDIEEWIGNLSDEEVLDEFGEDAPKRRVNESWEDYYDRIRMELIEERCRRADDPYIYFEDMIGSREMGNFLQEVGVIDVEKLAELAVEMEDEGIGHFLSFYDGKTIELDDDLLAFRKN